MSTYFILQYFLQFTIFLQSMSCIKNILYLLLLPNLLSLWTWNLSQNTNSHTLNFYVQIFTYFLFYFTYFPKITFSWLILGVRMIGWCWWLAWNSSGVGVDDKLKKLKMVPPACHALPLQYVCQKSSMKFSPQFDVNLSHRQG